MSKQKKDFLIETVVSNSSQYNSMIKTIIERLDENQSSDIASYENVIRDVINRAYVSTIVDEIASVIPTTVPKGKIPVFTTKYIGKNINGVSVKDNVVVLTVSDTTAFDVDGVVSSDNGGLGTVLYKETKQLLVKVTNNFNVGDNLDNVDPYADSKAVVEAIRSNVVGVGGILRNYTGPYNTETAETKEFLDSNAIDIQLKHANINVKTRKIFSGLTQEFIQDMISMYGVQGKEKLKSVISNAIEQTIEQEVFDFMRAISEQQADVVIKDPTTNNISITQAYEDIISRIYFSIGRIGTKTNISGDFFVIGSSNAIAAISATHRVTEGDFDGYNSKYAGKLDGQITLIEDPYSFDDYIIVGLAGPEEFDNGGVIVSPYNVDFIEAVNPDTLQNEIAIMSRYDIIRSPLDTKTVAGQSDFFELSVIDFSNVAK